MQRYRKETRVTGEQWVLVGLGTYLLLVAIAYAAFPPHSKEYMERGTDRILGINQGSTPCPVCYVATAAHSDEQTQNCLAVYFR